jgi:multidrug efflux pump subunit AcrA (membrane-fusion protein)
MSQRQAATLDGGVPSDDVTLQQMALAEAELDLREARRQLESTLLKAPIDGIIVDCNLREGDVVTMSGPAFVIADPREAEVDIEGDEFEVASITKGMPGAAFIDSLRVPPFAGHVLTEPLARRFGQPGLGPASLAFKFKIDQSVPTRLFGVSSRVEVDAARKDEALIVPADALLQDKGGVRVLVKRAGRFVSESVEVGIVTAEMVELIRGPREGTIVALGQIAELQQLEKP